MRGVVLDKVVLVLKMDNIKRCDRSWLCDWEVTEHRFQHT